MGFPAYGPLVSTPEGPTPQFIEVTDDGSRITLFIESLPDHTSIDSAKAAVLAELPADTIANSFFIANQGGGGPGQSCAFWNLSSVTLATLGAGGNKGSVSIEMAYDDSSGAPTYQPANINTVTFESGINDSTGTC